MNFSNSLAASLAMAGLLAGGSAIAQTPANPTPVATTQQKADEAMKKAIPADNVGTVVRTGETAAQKAATAAAAASVAVTPRTTTTTTTTPTATTTTVTTPPVTSGHSTVTTTTTPAAPAAAPRRAPRADRG